MSKKLWHCQFCGCSLQDDANVDSKFDSWNDPIDLHDLSDSFGGTGWQIGNI
jgi:hypothetical protein